MLADNIKEYVKERLSIVSDSDISETMLGNGRSGATVYRIKIKSRRHRLSGPYIIKICEISGTEELDEASKAAQLHSFAPQFADHLVKVFDSCKIENKHIILYEQANNSVLNSVPFSDLDGDHIAEYVRLVSCDFISKMNKNRKIQSASIDFFGSLLKKQLSESGRFASRMNCLLSKPEAECIAINGEIYPNPLYFIQNIHKIENNLSDFNFLKGANHGDLHGYNLLASDQNTYAVIDYDSVSMDSYLFFDHAYLEFSIYYDRSQNNDLKCWKAMLDRLILPSLYEEAKPCENYLEYMVRNAVCGGINDWIKNDGMEKMKDDIEIQFLMARIAAGINFFCKKTCADTGRQIKVLLYISYCFKILLKKINYLYNENDISSLNAELESNTSDELWESTVKYTNYIPVLITDDNYAVQDTELLNGLCGINWSMVIDIGLENSVPVIYKLFLGKCLRKTVKRINIAANEKVETFRHTLNIFALRKSAESSYAALWRSYGINVISGIKKLIAENPQTPILFIFDCAKNSLTFRNQLLNSLCDVNLPGGTRFIVLRSRFTEDLKEEISELENAHSWHFIEHIGTNLTHISQTCKMYLNEAYVTERYAKLPALDGIYIFTEKDLVHFESSIDLVYTGCEYNKEADGVDLYDNGDSFGEHFYKGNEVTWNDIAHHRDLPLVEKYDYEKILNKLLSLSKDNSPRVKMIELRHGAGTGGTTLAKRILWDLKDLLPCAYLNKYSLQTAGILLEIYQKTGNNVLLAVESGSTVITDEELTQLKSKIDSENGKLIILLIKRTDIISRKEEKELIKKEEKEQIKKKEKEVLYTLLDTMKTQIAKKFLDVFSGYASKKEGASGRKAMLEKITGNSDGTEQRSPFFYGFYTFQEEYELLRSLSRTVCDCSSCEQRLLNSLALITVFSQNICVAFRELLSILNLQLDESALNIYVLKEAISPALNKLIVVRKNGFRLCHQVIAIEILTLLHDPGNKNKEQDPDNKNKQLENVVFEATKMYIQTMSEIYGCENDYLNTILKELIIDRAYIDSEDRKTKFSILVEKIPHWTKRKELFEYLIQEFPDNPHYYNHLARLLAIGDKKNNILPQYEKAIKVGKQAIETAVTSINTHETTLGCIYGWWILSSIREQTDNKKKGRLSSSYSELLNDIRINYSLARSLFEDARVHADTYDSFSFFPQIKMECDIIRYLIGFDLERSLTQLLKDASQSRKIDEIEFLEWYEEHISIATELYSEMREYLKNDAYFLKEAKSKIREISENSVDRINEQFNEYLDSNAPADRRRSRSLIYRVYALNGFNWSNKGISQESLCLAERCCRKNLLEEDGEHSKYDFETWFELYRRVNYFSADDAHTMIADNMTGGYRKEYLLFLMMFIMRKKGIASATADSITRRIYESKRLATLHGLNTLYELDAYVSSGQNVTGCPIVSLSDVPRDENKEPRDLEVFTGVVTEVGQTHGKILLDKLNLDVTFIPRRVSSGEDPLKTFTREDVNCSVKLNIMFSYSGIRGWNVIKSINASDSKNVSQT